jgi:hypothetical protein
MCFKRPENGIEGCMLVLLRPRAWYSLVKPRNHCKQFENACASCRNKHKSQQSLWNAMCAERPDSWIKGCMWVFMISFTPMIVLFVISSCDCLRITLTKLEQCVVAMQIIACTKKQDQSWGAPIEICSRSCTRTTQPTCAYIYLVLNRSIVRGTRLPTPHPRLCTTLFWNKWLFATRLSFRALTL